MCKQLSSDSTSEHIGALMSNVKHGHYSNIREINPDCWALDGSLNDEQVDIACSYLDGRFVCDSVGPFNPMDAHEIVKVIYQYGRRRYAPIWEQAKRYVESDLYVANERVATAMLRRKNPT